MIRERPFAKALRKDSKNDEIPNEQLDEKRRVPEYRDKCRGKGPQRGLLF